jgi:hypothetical protein
MSIPSSFGADKPDRNGGLWPPVTRDRPCPKCGKPDWCCLSPDGAYLRCYRSDDGTGERRTDKSGQAYTLYRLNGAASPGKWPEPRYSPADGKGELADPDTLDKVYRALLRQLPLSDEHRQALADRGLQNGHKAAGYRTLARGRARAALELVRAGIEDRLPQVPGFYVAEKDGRRYWSIAGWGGLLVPVMDVRGRVVGLLVRPDDPGAAGGGKYRWLTSKHKGGVGPGAPVHVPTFDGSRERVRVTEGALKANVATAQSGTLTIGLPGVAAFKKAARTLQALGTMVAPIAFDADARRNRHVAEALARLVEHLRRRGFMVQLELWDEADGKGIDDLLKAGKQPDLIEDAAAIDRAVAQVLAEAREADPAPGPAGGAGAGGNPLPRIVWNDRQLRDVTGEALDAVRAANDPPRLFRRSGLLVRTRFDQETGAASVELMTDAALCGHLARVADWWTVTATRNGIKETQTSPSGDVVKDLASLPAWPGLPALRGVVEVPVFGRDGVLVDRPGYHPAAQLWYEPAPGLTVPPVPARPTAADVARARDLILVELLGDFPFEDEASRAHAVAALLLHFVRELIDGPTPFHLLDAPTEGTGKTLLVNCVGRVATGRDPEAMPECRDDDEWRKKIFATLAEGPAFVFLDNLNRLLDSGALASALTARVVKDRILGLSKTGRAPNTAVWLGSGNNTRLSRELIRRTVWCRLDAKMENPWERPQDEFRHPNLPAWVRENRGELVGAALTLVQAWVAAGRPAGKQTLGMFDAWVETVGGILDVAGIPGLLGNVKQFRRAAADKAGEWAEFVTAWWAKFAGSEVGVKELFILANSEKLLDSVLGDGQERSQRTRLGVQLAKARGRVVGCHRIVAAEEDNSGRKLYHLGPVEAQPPPPAQGEGGGATPEDVIELEA